MSKQTEALKLALEALIAASGHVNNEIFVKVMMARDAVNDAIREALAEQPAPPPECKTDAEKAAFAFGWWKALEENRKQPAQQQEPVALDDQLDDALNSLVFYRRRVEALQQWQSKMRDPERTIVCDIIANGHTLEPAGDRYKQPAQQEPVAWRELCRRLYVELYWCDRQMMEKLDEDGEPMWTQGKEVRDVLADAKAALETPPPAVGQEPVAAECKFDHEEKWARCNSAHHNLVQSEPEKWPGYQTRLLYTSPQASKPWVGLTDEEMKAIHRNAGVSYLVPADYDRHLFTHLTDVQLMKISKAIEAKLREKNA